MSSPPSSQTDQLGTNFPLANQTNGSNSTANPSSTDPVTVTAGSSRNPSLQQIELSPPKPDKKGKLCNNLPWYFSYKTRVFPSKMITIIKLK